MANEKEKEQDKEIAVILQKLKRLMTITEKDVIEENKQKEAVLQISAEEKDTAHEATEHTVEKKEKVKKPFLKIVDSDPHFDEKSDNTQQDENENPVENEDDVELIGNHERVVQERAKSKRKNTDNAESNSTEKTEQITDSPDDDDDDDDDNDDGDDVTNNTVDNKSKNNDPLYDLSGLENAFEKRPRKRKKSFFNSLFKFGQALNAKPDEYTSDEGISNLHSEAETTEKKKRKSQKSSKTETESKTVSSSDSDTPQTESNSPDDKAVDSAPIVDVDMSFATVQKVNGNIFIEGDIEPMYTIETTPTTFNIEIGKLSPILMNAYEAYLSPDALQAKKAEQDKKEAEILEEDIITKPTTPFVKHSSSDIDKRIFEDKNETIITTSDNIDEDDNDESYEELPVSEKEKKRQAKLKAKEEKRRLKKAEKERKNKKSIKETLFTDYGTAVDYSAFSVSDSTAEKIEDYEHVQDARAVMVEINMNIRNEFFRTLITSIIFALELVLTIFKTFFPTAFDGLIPNVDLVYCTANLVLLAIAIGVSANSIKRGLIPLLGFKGNSETGVAVASIAVTIQSIAAFFDCYSFFHGSKNLYAILVVFALALNSLGRMVQHLRIKDNFRFVANDRKKYAVTILNDKRNAERMVRGTNADDPVIAYQRKTQFFSNFMKLSYAKDPSESMASSFSLISLVVSVVISIIHGIIYQSAIGAISSFAMISSISVPLACMLAVNIPIRKLCSKALREEAMVVGYPAVTQFVDTAAIMLDSRELYPPATVKLVRVKQYMTSNFESCILNAAAVLKVANTSLSYVFTDVINDKSDQLPYVDSVKFEENKGIVGWIGGERVLIGRRELLEKYGITPPPFEDAQPFLDENRNVTYLANAGQLVAMIVTSYAPNNKLKAELQRLEKNGVSVLIRTADPNLTSKRIASDYDLHIRSVKILPNSLGNICKEALKEKSGKARCYIGTRGKTSSLARAVAGCIKIKTHITIAVLVQLIGLIIMLCFGTAVAVMSGDLSVSSFALICSSILWTIMDIAIPLLLKV
ncbi:MAG: hypothetical protein UD936_03175 [Acutalibacteraceae bacterium]|nr:hypothetical protein [Acutalibacteraceae bacterium]